MAAMPREIYNALLNMDKARRFLRYADEFLKDAGRTVEAEKIMEFWQGIYDLTEYLEKEYRR